MSGFAKLFCCFSDDTSHGSDAPILLEDDSVSNYSGSESSSARHSRRDKKSAPAPTTLPSTPDTRWAAVSLPFTNKRGSWTDELLDNDPPPPRHSESPRQGGGHRSRDRKGGSPRSVHSAGHRHRDSRDSSTSSSVVEAAPLTARSASPRHGRAGARGAAASESPRSSHSRDPSGSAPPEVPSLHQRKAGGSASPPQQQRRSDTPAEQAPVPTAAAGGSPQAQGSAVRSVRSAASINSSDGSSGGPEGGKKSPSRGSSNGQRSPSPRSVASSLQAGSRAPVVPVPASSLSPLTMVLPPSPLPSSVPSTPVANGETASPTRPVGRPGSVQRTSWDAATLERFLAATMIDGPGLALLKHSRDSSKKQERVLRYDPNTMILSWNSRKRVTRDNTIAAWEISNVQRDGNVVTVEGGARGSTAFEATKERDAMILAAIMTMLAVKARTVRPPSLRDSKHG